VSQQRLVLSKSCVIGFICGFSPALTSLINSNALTPSLIL
jgi:hypothetical protein